MQKTSRLNRLLAVLVAVFMAVCCLPLNAFAEVGHISDGRMEINVFYYDEEGNSKGSGIAMVPLQNFSDKETGKGMVNANDMTGVPEGYEICSTGDYPFDNFNVTVTVRPVKEEPTQPETPEKPTEVIMNFAFIDENGNNVGGGDQFVPNTGTANYNVLDLPEGYELASTGDFFVVEGGHQDVSVRKIKTEVIMNFAFIDENGNNVGGGDQFVPNTGTANYNVLDLPEGYELASTGDFFVVEGGHQDVSVRKIKTEVIMNFAFIDENGNNVGGGDQFVPNTGTANYNVLDLPEGYELASTGDFFVVEGGHQDVSVRKIKTEVIMNFVFVDENGNNVGGGDQFVPNTGTANYNVLDLPEGYELVETGDFFVEEGKSLTVKVKKTVTSQTVGLNFYDETSEEQICEVEVELPADAIHMNTNDMLDYLPEGYDFVVTGDLAINDGWIYVGVKPTKTLRIYWAIDNGDAADFADGSADTWTQELTWKHIHDEIALPQITVADGYVFNGWSVSGQNGEFWGPELKTMTVGDKFVADEKGGVISIIANIVTREAGQGGSTGGNNGGSTGSSEQSGATATAASAGNDTVVKTAAPADNSVKILPQTGFTAEAPAVFGGMLFAALAGAGAYLFGMRKKLNETF